MAKIFRCFQYSILNKKVNDISVLSRACTTEPAKIVSLSYKILGEATSDPPKPPIFIFHDILGNKKQWESIGKTIKIVTKRTVVVVDLRNHGDSPHGNSHKYTHQARDVIELFETLGANQATLIGYSIGGKTAMCVALMAPKSVSGLILVDISPVSRPRGYSQYLLKMLKAMEKIDFKNYKTVTIAKKEVRKELKDFVEDGYMMNTMLANIRRKSGKFRWSCNLSVLIRDHKYIMAFPEKLTKRVYNGPTLFIGGQLSEFIPADDLIKIRHIFPLAVITYIPKTNHRVHVQDPQSFLELLISFLKNKC